MILCDTNLLLYSAQPDDPRFSEATGFILNSLARGEQLVVSSQNLAEFWNVATRPLERNGFGFSVSRADADLDYPLESIAVLLQHEVQGVQVHDARLVAGMKAYGIGHVATYNGKDFTRHTGVTVHNPKKLPD